MITTRSYSTSFSLGIYCLAKKFHQPVYAIYGFVRFADEIVDSFHGYDKELLLKEFRQETVKAIDRNISLNPVLNSFQAVVHAYGIEMELVDSFLNSMETDLRKDSHNSDSYKGYIYGSAEVVGLMCLRVFTENNTARYLALKPAARSLGAAFQKVNFLRDLKSDVEVLGRVYFPGLNPGNFDVPDKQEIERDIEADFKAALEGIRSLPAGSRFGVYVAYIYYRQLFNKIRNIPPGRIMNERVRIPNHEKMLLLVASYLRHRFKLI